MASIRFEPSLQHEPGVESSCLIGQTLSHFEITAMLGKGGMGEVYLALDTRLERKVALKVLPPELAGDPERLKRLVREAKALAALDHPHIVTVFSVEEADGVHFLTMAYVEGRALDTLIPEGGLPIEKLLDHAVSLADALRAAHERGIIHRDLKPANVMVDDEGRLRVLDFGLAKRNVALVGEQSQLTTQGLTEQMTREGTILGSYPYMSPEQAEGRQVDARSDLFSLGTMLYEMASGDRPFAGETGISLITAILRDTPAPLADRRPDLPQRLVEIIERCLEKGLDERYASAAELREDLKSARREVRRGTAAPASATTVTGTPVRSKSARLVVIVAIALLALIAGVWSWWDRQPPDAGDAVATAREISSIAVLPLTNLTGDPEQEYFVDGMTEALITDLSKIGALKVIARSSVMRYKETGTPASEVAADLGVDAVVEGSVIREGNRVGITAQLIDAETDETLWAERYERDMTSILSLQSEIARAIAGEIHVTLTAAEQSLLAATRDVDPAAHEAYLKGMFHLQKFTPQDFELALRYLETALDIDPDYALAHTGVANVWGYKSQFGLVPAREANTELRKALDRALELDDSLAEAQLTLAITTTWYEWDWQQAEIAFRRAIALNPNYAEARVFFSHFLALLGRAAESTAQFERALELDPLNPFYQGLYGIQLMMVGRVEESIDQLLGTLERTPGLGFGRRDVALILFGAGRNAESLRELKIHYREIGATQIVQALERGELEGGYVGALSAAADAAADMAATRHYSHITLAALFSAARRPEEAFAWLQRGYEIRDPDMPYIGVLPYVFGLRQDARFQDLLLRMNLPDVRSEPLPLEDASQRGAG